MKFIVSSSALLKQLSSLSGVLNTSNALPILDNFLFQINQGELKISASDLETTITSSLVVESRDEGTIAVPARLLLDTLKTFPEQPLTFTIDKKKFSIEISSDYGKYKLTGHDGGDFPKIAEMEGPSSFEIDTEALSKAIAKTLFAVGNDELRPVMCGVFVQIESSEIIFVATDAHKLVRFIQKDSKSKKSASYIIPKKPLTLLKNVLTGNGKVQVEYNTTNVSFSFGNILLISRLIDGKYPNYDAVIPKENPNKMIVDREAFLNSIRRVSIFANKTTNQVRLKVIGNELNISAEDLDFSNEANERLTCSYLGEDMEIGFNSKFLAEMLSNIDCEEVQFEMSTPNRAGVMVPAKSTDKEEDILMLVMPVMLNN
jgi:DNA polymerase III subunit beta